MNAPLTHLNANAQRASALMKALGNPYRLSILCHLSDGEVAVGRLSELTGLGQSAVSQHLARLRRQGLVRCRRDRQMVYYSLSGSEAEAVMDTLCRLYGKGAREAA